MIVHHRKVSLSFIDDHDDSFLYVLKSLKTLQQIFSQLGKFICSRLTYMRLVYHQNHLHLWIYVEKTLHKEGVRDLVLLTLVILESRTIVKCQVIDHQFVGNWSLGVLLVTYFDWGTGTVKDGFQSLVTDNHFLTSQEGKDGGLSDTSVSDNDDGLVAGSVLGDSTDSLPDHLFDFEKVERSFHSNDYDYTTPNDHLLKSSQNMKLYFSTKNIHSHHNNLPQLYLSFLLLSWGKTTFDS